MKRSWFKRMGGTNCFTDFKHHHESWRNSKKIRARNDRSRMKRELKKERDLDND